MKKAEWCLLVVSLPGPSKTERMRLWRALRAAGAGALRDGVYVLPHSPEALEVLEAQANNVLASGGSAEVIAFDSQSDSQQKHLRALFDRGSDYAALVERAKTLTTRVGRETEVELRRVLAALRRDVAALMAIDFFPGPSAAQLDQALADAEGSVAELRDGNEPKARRGGVPRRDITRYQGRLWATRKRLWVDRVASAWLIRRFIDPKARFRWLRQPKDCPKTAIGFDFDGAEFTHIGARVTFEVLLASFGLDRDLGLVRLGSVVHALDVGGAPAAEAAGLAAIMTGYRAQGLDDDTLLAQASSVLDAFYAGFNTAGDSTP